TTLDALDMAKLIKDKTITADECLEASKKIIEKENPKINAVVYPMFDHAKQALKTLPNEAPLYGVPFLLKDLLDSYKGVPLSNGSKAFKNYIPDYDAVTVERYKAAGLNIVGKSNCPELGLMGITEPELHGATRNPWNIKFTPGGSSGGSAAAIAAGMVPAASAGDGGGSIRIPASYCGLFGLKPSRGRTPTGPQHGRVWHGATSLGVLSRSVADSALLLDIVSGPEVGAPYGIEAPIRSFLDETRRECRPLKIALNTDSPVGACVDPEIIASIQMTAKLLEELGHSIEYKAPAIDNEALVKSYIIMYTADTAEVIRSSQELTGVKPSMKNFELITWILSLLGNTYSAADLHWAVNLWDKTAHIMGEFHNNYDLYLTPTVAAAPPRIGEFDLSPLERMGLSLVGKLGFKKLIRKSGVIEATAAEMLAKTPFTQLANFTGQPAMSLPLGMSSEQLPIGSQFIAKRGDEATLFNLAAQVERAYPWSKRRAKA
ncbi:amidase family protein, partial [Desulfobacterales bacterium HSG16]|nr:amidase family protein [Desulfobacterales bacterium HSG16]